MSLDKAKVSAKLFGKDVDHCCEMNKVDFEVRIKMHTLE